MIAVYLLMALAAAGFFAFLVSQSPHTAMQGTESQRRDIQEAFLAARDSAHNLGVPEQYVVGTAIYLAHSYFTQRYGQVESFLDKPEQERELFVARLKEVGSEIGQISPLTAFGIQIYKHWFDAKLLGFDPLAQYIIEQLTPLMSKGKTLESAFKERRPPPDLDQVTFATVIGAVGQVWSKS